MKKKHKIIVGVIVSLLLIQYLVTLIVPPLIDKQHNQIRENPPYKVSNEASNLYNSLEFVGDMHCDALLWKRDLLKDNNFEQVDIPKMLGSNTGRIVEIKNKQGRY